MSMEKRLVLAFVVSAVIFVIWTVLNPPPKRVSPVSPTPSAETSEARPTEVGEAAVESVGDEAAPGPSQVAEARPPVVVVPAVEGSEERRLTLANDAVRLEVTSRGAAVRSMVLLGYEGDDESALDLVQSVANPRRTLPLELVGEDGPDQRLYACEERDGEVHCVWSDGLGSSVEKVFRVPEKGYGVEVEVGLEGALRDAWVSLGTGMRDTGPVERANRFATWGDVGMLVGGELRREKREKVKEELELDGSGVGFVGFEDTYFLSLLMPEEAISSIAVVPLEYEEVAANGKPETVKVLQLNVRPAGGGLAGTLFAAPKEYELLQRVDGGVEQTLHFGFFHPISVIFLKALRWIFALVGNYGLAIILLTLAIRIVLFPLMHTSTVSMRKMQKLQPKIKAIQEKYRKNKSDPQVRAKMNQETMALYKLEGVNPVGGCLPMLVQLPILWALYTLFAHAIELRHAPFIFWITDLSAKDPYYITPVLMTASMWLQQKMAPQAGDAQQQKIFRLMPLVFGVMFLGFPSGLVLYWLANNVITIVQQEITLRMIGERKAPARAKRKRG